MIDKNIVMQGDDWYLNTIEEPVRDIVRALRNNGINTECSCGHDMTIQCQTIDPTTELLNIRSVFMMLGVTKYRLELIREVIDDQHFDSITFFDNEGKKPIIAIDSEIPCYVSVEIIAHEAAHVIAGHGADHGEQWEAVFDEIYMWLIALKWQKFAMQ